MVMISGYLDNITIMGAYCVGRVQLCYPGCIMIME